MDKSSYPLLRDRPSLAVSMTGSFTKKGTIIYRAGSSAVRDGGRLTVSNQADRAGVVVALRQAMEPYGERISVSGLRTLGHLDRLHIGGEAQRFASMTA